MATNINVYGDLTPRSAGYVVGQLLERGQYDMVTERFGQAKPLPKRSTKTMKFRRYEPLPRAIAPLSEGIPPTGRKLAYTDVNATLEQYGDFVPISDVVFDTHEDNVPEETINLLSEQISETIEVIRIAVLKSGTNVFYANSVAGRSTVNSPPLRADFRRIYRYFMSNKARKIKNIVKASAMVSTEPVAASYFVMGSTDLDADIRGIEGFLPSEQYSNSDKMVHPAEIGKVEQYRIILTPLFEPWLAAGASGITYLSNGEKVSSAASCDVYPLIVVAQNAYAMIPLQGMSAVTPMLKRPQAQVGDELGQQGFASWKMYQTVAILQQSWIARLECAATAAPS